ncbi:MAG TPA: UDP-N-acetylmuramate dehydrogenase [Bacteroidales bacterium]|nr:UDP-N-acetylmuramate dehydrogenase [Bacteroidales bacterium]
MTILENHSLKRLNTFGIDAWCRYFAEVSSVEQLKYLLGKYPPAEYQHLILGGGSNILFTGNFEGLVVKISNKGVWVTFENEHEVVVKAAAGEEWDKFVEHCVSEGWSGLENLSLIPGQVGSSPIQNIGAYGVELKDIFECLEAYDKTSQEIKTFVKSECRFEYRSSIFKNEARGRYVILTVSFRLKKVNHCLRLEYEAVSSVLKKMGKSKPSIADVREAVCSIRRAKLPDPAVVHNAGSFFKNPVIDSQTYQELSQKHKGLVAFLENKNYKLSAGWLIEKAGWKGYREGDAGIHPLHALVLVNYGKATGMEILNLSDRIKRSVLQQFGVDLEGEVNIH